MNKFDSHVILFEKWILNTAMRKSKFVTKDIIFSDFDRRSSRPFKNYRLLEYLKNDEIDFYKGNRPYKKRYE